MNTAPARNVLATALLGTLLAGPALGQWDRSPRVWAGGGYWGGDVTYQIGGEVTMNGESTTVHNPISELTWPTEVVTFSGGMRLPVGEHVDLYLDGFGVGTSDSGTVEDRDWLVPGVLSIESESDASLSGFGLHGGGRWWFDLGGPAAAHRWQVSAGAGLLYQSLSWEASNLDQWYPMNPSLPHDRIAGLVGTYDLDLTMPYIEGGFRLAFTRARLAITAGFAPYVRASDVDDHVLRSILAETDATGVGGLGSATLEFDLSARFFLQLRADVFSFVADGTEENVTYAGADAGSTWTIEHEITSTQGQLTLGLGAVL